MKAKLAASAALLLFALATPSLAQPIEGYSIEAWCVGGFAGRWDKATIEADGTIRATNSAIQPEPWPVVATEPQLAQQWLTAAIAANAQAMENMEVYRDGINCGLDLHLPDGTKSPLNVGEIFEGLIGYVPPRGF